MVLRLLTAIWLCVWCSAAAGQEITPPIRQLDDASRVRVLAALSALIILGFAMVLLTWLGARITQRYRRGSSYFRRTERPDN